jgi:hypothetical protein
MVHIAHRLLCRWVGWTSTRLVRPQQLPQPQNYRTNDASMAVRQYAGPTRVHRQSCHLSVNVRNSLIHTCRESSMVCTTPRCEIRRWGTHKVEICEQHIFSAWAQHLDDHLLLTACQHSRVHLRPRMRQGTHTVSLKAGGSLAKHTPSYCLPAQQSAPAPTYEARHTYSESKGGWQPGQTHSFLLPASTAEWTCRQSKAHDRGWYHCHAPVR